MNRLSFVAACAAASVIAATPASAGIQDFTLINSTGYVVMEVFVSPSSESSWGPDILGMDVLGDGESASIGFETDSDECHWDIRVTYDDGDSSAWSGFDLCTLSVVEIE